MFGHQMYRQLKDRHEVRVTVRRDFIDYQSFDLFQRATTYDHVDATDFSTVVAAVRDFHPDVVVNAVGIIKQLAASKQSIPTLEVNALFPHRLAELTQEIKARLVHLSTDCIFSGEQGGYTEESTPDATDLYGRTKYLGEVSEPHTLTLRKSLIGPELHRKVGLLEWILKQNGEARGFRQAIFSGLSTLELARVVEWLLVDHPKASGVYHVSSEPINKYELMLLVQKAYKLDLIVRPDDTVKIDRSLNSSRFREDFGYVPPSWESMVHELASYHGIDQGVRFSPPME